MSADRSADRIRVSAWRVTAWVLLSIAVAGCEFDRPPDVTPGRLELGVACLDDQDCASGLCGAGPAGAICCVDEPLCARPCGACSTDGRQCTAVEDNVVCDGEPVCAGAELVGAHSVCDGAGDCVARDPSPCPGALQCDGVGACRATCAANVDCIDAHYCVIERGACLPKRASGQPCAANQECLSGTCDIDHCA